jgi:hypothetical protein
MKRPGAASLLLLAGLAGCGGSPPSGTVVGTPIVGAQNVTGNWQIQSGAAGSAAGVLLLGDLSSSGAAVTGTFRFSDLAQGNGCGALNQVITVSGSVDITNPLAQVLNLTSAPFGGSVLTAQLSLPALLHGFGAGTNFASSPAIGSEFAPLAGTYAGTITPSTGSGGAGPAVLVLSQATSPSADGQFAVSGSLQFTGAGCTAAVAVSGTASGVGVMVSASPTLTNPTVANVIATQPPLGSTQNLSANVLFYSGTCAAVAGLQYTGTLVKQ